LLVQIVEEPVERLAEHLCIPIAFRVESVLDVLPVDGGLGGVRREERPLVSLASVGRCSSLQPWSPWARPLSGPPASRAQPTGSGASRAPRARLLRPSWPLMSWRHLSGHFTTS
jgi:hypothetical protein